MLLPRFLDWLDCNLASDLKETELATELPFDDCMFRDGSMHLMDWVLLNWMVLSSGTCSGTELWCVSLRLS